MANVVLAILGISLLMIVHEGGHYLMARLHGMRVERFSIGFGPAIVKWKPRRSPTTFQLCVIPLLAYVRIAGTNPTEPNDPKDSGLYENKSVLARALTIAGGPIANYLFASLVVLGLAMSGWREQVAIAPVTVEIVQAGSSAEAAGVQKGDVLVEVEGQPVKNVVELRAITHSRGDMSTSFVFERGGTRLPAMTIVPKKSGDRAIIGITGTTQTFTRKLSVGAAAKKALWVPWSITAQSGEGIGDLARRRSTEGLTGPIGMTKQMAKEADAGAYAFFGLLLSISVAIGFFNLLPMPFLDGGKLVFLFVEAIRGRRVHRTAEALVHVVGMLILLLGAVAVTFRDLAG